MRLSQLGALACCALLTTNIAHANVFDRLWEGAFAESYELIQQSEPEALKLQTLATYYTFVGRQDLQGAMDGEVPQASTQCLKGAAQNVRAVNARDWLLEQTADKRLVMFNENHYRIEARLFLFELLDALKEQGFTHIGFEAFSQPPSETSANSHHFLPEEGFYTHEPIFASLIHRAYELGFDVFGYESTEPVPDGASFAERVNIREEAQAENILERVDGADESSKFVIFAGWSHITETPQPPEDTLWMAARVKTKTGIDPFTVDLTSCAVVKASAAKSVVYLNDDSQVIVAGQFTRAVDAQVHLAIPDETSIHSGFYRQYLGEPVSLPSQLEDIEQPLLVKAYATDRTTSVAIDQVLVHPGEAQTLKLYLPAGHAYELRAYSGNGEVLWRQVEGQ